MLTHITYKGSSRLKKTVKKADIVCTWGRGANPSSLIKPKFTGSSNHPEMVTMWSTSGHQVVTKWSRRQQQQQYRVHGEDNTSKKMFYSLASRHLLIRLIKLDQIPVYFFFSFASKSPLGETFWVGSSLLQPAPSLFPPSPSPSLLFPIIPLLFLISFIHSFIVDLFLTIVDDLFVCNG